MNEREKEKMLELLSDKAVFGLTDAEIADLSELEKNFPEVNDDSFEFTAAKIGMINLDTGEQLPAHLRTKIIADADKYFASRKDFAASATPEKHEEEFQKTFAYAPKTSILQWLGWAVAGLACIALAITLWTTRQNPTLVAVNPTPTATPKLELTPAQEREQLLASAKDAVQSNWGDFNPKDPKNVQGDVVWSNSLQKGFVRFRNLPANDQNKETYQVWIFDKSQKNPVSGGIFNINKDGEAVIPIDSALKIQEPTMVGITAEKPGGVVVSDLKKVLAVAKFSA